MVVYADLGEYKQNASQTQGKLVKSLENIVDYLFSAPNVSMSDRKQWYILYAI